MSQVIPQSISLENYNYSLPDENIAKFPVQNRDQSKLLIYNSGMIAHDKFDNLTNYLPPNSHLVFNNTRVIPARLLFETSSGAKIEILLLKPIGVNSLIDEVLDSTSTCFWQCMIGNKKRWKSDEILQYKLAEPDFNCNIFVELIVQESNSVKFYWESFNQQVTFKSILDKIGQIPLPPYIDRQPISLDKETYQTVYSKSLGAVAAPTAGLHFTDKVFDDLKNSNFTLQNITLHVGAGTFLPIKEENVLNHKMHNEQIIFDLAGILTLIEKIDNIIPVGTTSLRALESLYWFGVKLILSEHLTGNSIQTFFIDKLYPYSIKQNISADESLSAIVGYMNSNKIDQIIGETEIFIFPGYQFKLCKGIITNFHQPKSTLLLLIAALVGPNWKQIYLNALSNNYRFLSYGDSSLLLP
jgi:S-adenosylmethionine:tRNA ribosyltransferase-isomerase